MIKIGRPESLLRRTAITAALSLSVISLHATAGELTFGGFSEMTYKAVDSKTPQANSNTFAQGGIDLYLTKSLDSKTNMLAEVVFELNEENEAVLDPERIWIQHEFDSWFKLKAGRVHTALGYWNETFHHGSWLQTSASRPAVFNFEDDGGILPVHAIGLEFRGSGQVGNGTLGYIGNIGNGRGVNGDPPQSAVDYDANKSINLLVYYEMPHLSDLRFGVVYYQDKLDATTAADGFDHDKDATTAAVARAGMDETITGAHIIWRPGNTEVIFEGFRISHKIDSATVTALAEEDSTLTARYLQVSHKMDMYTPYARFESFKSDSSAKNTYLVIAADQEDKAVVAGVRYDFTYTSAITFELTKAETTVAGTTTADSTTYALNWAYAW